jgi:hypothetical protein
MTFVHPEAWFWALLAVPLALLHLRRRRPRRVCVAAGFLWQQILEAGTPRARWLRWRPAASLAADLAVLLLIVAAMAVLTAQWYLFQRRWIG